MKAARMKKVRMFSSQCDATQKGGKPPTDKS